MFEEIVRKLGTDEKAALVADFSAALAATGAVVAADWDGVNARGGYLYPSFNALAAGWNTRLVSEVAQDLAYRAKSEGADLMYTPEIRFKGNPYSDGVSEDAYFARVCAYTVLRTLKNCGVTPCLSGCYLDGNDIKFMDLQPDERVLREQYFAPAEALAAVPEGAAAVMRYKNCGGEYSGVNRRVYRGFLREAVGANGIVVSAETDANAAVGFIKDGGFCKGASQSEIKRAVENYRTLRGRVLSGEAAAAGLEDAQAAGTAINEQALDGAVERILAFAASCKLPAAAGAEDSRRLAQYAAEECAVLMKNDGLLPLQRGAKIAVIGAGAERFASRAAGVFSVLGTAAGFGGADRNDALAAEAAALAKDAEAVVVLFKARRQTGGKVRLPANNLALLDALYGVNKNIIAVIPAGESVDVSFDESVSALLAAAVDGDYGLRALINILCGATCPSGKLVFTYYEDTDEVFSRLVSDKNAGRIKIGQFTGYRNYDTAAVKVKYPFGHGLSYTTFGYSDLEINSEFIEVTVTNTGAVAGAEVVQLYIGKPNSRLLRPKKELKGFTKLCLKAGESKKVRFKLNGDALSVYDRQSGKKIIEAGEYDIYIASSVSDVRLCGKTNVQGVYPVPEEKRLTEYLSSASNVVKEGYTLAPAAKVRKSAMLTKISAVLMFIFFTLCDLFVCLHFTGVLALEESRFANSSLIVSAILFAAFLALTVTGVVTGKRAAANVRAARRTERAQPARPFDVLFEEEFADCETEEFKNPAAREDNAKYYNDSLTFAGVCGQLTQYAAARGIVLEKDGAAKILAAMCASRLVVIKSPAPSLIPKLTEVLCGYFRSDKFADDCADYRLPEHLFVRQTEQGGTVGTGVARAAEAAAATKYAAHICCLYNTDLSSAEQWFSPLSRYVTSPETTAALTTDDGRVLALSPNLWFFMPFGGGVGGALAERCAVIDLRISETAEQPVLQPEFLSYFQLMRLCGGAENIFVLDEEKCFKKIDKFERLVAADVKFAIDNKKWQALEKFTCVYAACGGGETEAMDCGVAAVLLPAVCALYGAAGKKKLAIAIAEAFGEENIAACKKVLN